MTEIQYKKQFDELKEIWESRNPQKVTGLVADKFYRFETPFDEPYTTKEELVKEWQGILEQKDISVSYRILSNNKNVCIAQWHALFLRLPAQEKVELDGIFQVTLNSQGKCTEFRQWYNANN